MVRILLLRALWGKPQSFLLAPISVAFGAVGPRHIPLRPFSSSRQGWQVQDPRTEDCGTDLVVEKDGERIAIQVLQPVLRAVRHCGADKAIIITNSRFTPNAGNLVRSNNVYYEIKMS
ncbi:MAG: restriction endonuclease [Bacillota bacterium]